MNPAFARNEFFVENKNVLADIGAIQVLKMRNTSQARRIELGGHNKDLLLQDTITGTEFWQH